MKIRNDKELDNININNSEMNDDKEEIADEHNSMLNAIRVFLFRFWIFSR